MEFNRLAELEDILRYEELSGSNRPRNSRDRKRLIVLALLEGDWISRHPIMFRFDNT
ncbi:MAG: hypothetical protein BMS9Abin02_0105 [Anaerolineae bacterium]|nr:MAG: hypothetical protein BMS9Abin02_0105 [Anaerolineae bacterium]